MTRRWMLSTVMAAVMAAQILPGVGAADLQPAKNETNPEKRSRLALTAADQALGEARTAYEAQDMKAVEARLDEVRAAVELAQASLTASGKKPGKSPGPYKYAETKSRELLRRLEGLKQEVDAADRPVVETVENKVQEIHDAWLDGILTHAK